MILRRYIPAFSRLSALAAGVLVSLALSDGARAQGPGGGAPALVEVAPATQADLRAVTRMPGTVISRNDSVLAAAVAGRIDWIAEVGTSVEQGEVIARIDARDWAIQARESEAQITRLKARLGYEEAEVGRMRRLAEQGNAPQSRLEQALATRDGTVQELTQARLQLERAQVGLDRTRVEAPFPGRIVDRLSAPGEYASPGSGLVRLVDTTHLEVRAQVPVDLAGRLDSGGRVGIETDTAELDAPIRTVVPVGDEISRTVELRATLDRPVWMVGTPVRVRIPRGEEQRLVTVPRDALILRPGQVFVYVVEDGKARRMAVEPGLAQGDRIAVSGPVAPGDQVVVRGGERLSPGRRVTIKGAAAASGATSPQAS